MKERILDKAIELFFRYGIRTITMDDIARELGISKKTIYQHFQDKEDIIFEALQSHFNKEKCNAEEIRMAAPDPIAEVVMSSQQLRQAISGMNPTLIFDIKRYHPRAWEAFVGFKNGFILEVLRNNLERGKALGLYRADMHIDILAILRNEEVDLGFDPQIFPPSKFNILEVQLIILDHFLRGVLTPKGLELYENYLQQSLIKDFTPIGSHSN